MKVSPHVRAKVTPDGVLFLDITNGLMFAANHIGALIWQRLEAGCSQEQIVAELSREHHTVTTIADDVREFIAGLQRRAFLNSEGEV